MVVEQGMAEVYYYTESSGLMMAFPYWVGKAQEELMQRERLAALGKD